MKKKATEPRRTLGPVPDLERHLPSDWWRHLFSSIYLKTDGDVVENIDATKSEVDVVVRAAGLEPNDRILDLCCGQGRHAIELAQRGFTNVTGVDRSRYLIRLARRRASMAGVRVRFHEGDARRYRNWGEPFHCVMILGNSFGYFDLEADDEAVLRTVQRSLASGGSLVLDITDGTWMSENYQPRSWEWVDQQHFVCRERALSTNGERLITREVVVHADRGVIADQFYAERLYSVGRITSLLEQEGFTNIRHHGTMEGNSSRGQDLGMMAHRLFLLARSPRHVRVPASRIVPCRVAVILGDPQLGDPVKKGGRFQSEDIETVNRLKKALGELGQYEFDYIENHDTLPAVLRQQKPELVFNLCDEGYRNDAAMELHIPAWLEMLEIPYTGSGPACLGLCYDKALVSAIATSLDIPVPLETSCGPDDTSATLPSTFPALVKPCRGDGSLGITQKAVVHDAGELMAYLGWLRETYGRGGVLVQEFLSGPEYSIGVLGNPGNPFQILPALEVDYSRLDPQLPKLLPYESKWHPESPYWTRISYKEAELDPKTRRQLHDYSYLLFEKLDCRDYARFDYRRDSAGTIKLIDVNPNPGWCWDGKLNLMAGFAGLRYADLLRSILEAARERQAIPVPQPVPC